MLQRLSTNPGEFCRKALPFLYVALAASVLLGTPAVALGTVGADCFHVFDATLFKNKPNLGSQGLEPARVVDPDRWLLPGQARGQIPNESSVQAGLRPTNPSSGILVLDSEDWPEQGAEALPSLNKYLTLLSIVRHVGVQGLVGYYGVPPIRDYWRAIGPTNSQAYRAWQSENDVLQPLADAVDVLYPSIYTFYDDQDGWTRYAIANLAEARRLARGKPVYAFIWPQFHVSNKTLALTFISGDFWALQLQTVAKYADGVIIWGGFQDVWDAQAAWWLATQEFLRTQPQICKNPNAPSAFRVYP